MQKKPGKPSAHHHGAKPKKHVVGKVPKHKIEASRRGKR